MNLLPGGRGLARSSSPATARALVASARCRADAVQHRRAVLDAIDADAMILDRDTRPGHLTGSGLVVDSAGQRFVLVHHRKLRIWVQPGGHADGEGNLARVAFDECAEETGIERLRVAVPAIDVDIHQVAPPGDDPHLHYDVRFLVLAPPGATLDLNHESIEGRWVRWADADDAPIDEGTRRMVAAGRDALADLHGGSLGE